jgi:hypothetical protein
MLHIRSACNLSPWGYYYVLSIGIMDHGGRARIRAIILWISVKDSRNLRFHEEICVNQQYIAPAMTHQLWRVLGGMIAQYLII